MVFGYKTSLCPYVGGGVNFATQSSTMKLPAVAANAGALIQTTTTDPVGADDGLTFGVNAALGVEYFITKDISLGAEYQLGLNITSLYDQSQTQTQGSLSTTTVTKEGSTTALATGLANGGRLTLGIYF